MDYTKVSKYFDIADINRTINKIPPRFLPYILHTSGNKAILAFDIDRNVLLRRTDIHDEASDYMENYTYITSSDSSTTVPRSRILRLFEPNCILHQNVYYDLEVDLLSQSEHEDNLYVHTLIPGNYPVQYPIKLDPL